MSHPNLSVATKLGLRLSNQTNHKSTGVDNKIGVGVKTIDFVEVAGIIYLVFCMISSVCSHGYDCCSRDTSCSNIPSITRNPASLNKSYSENAEKISIFRNTLFTFKLFGVFFYRIGKLYLKKYFYAAMVFSALIFSLLLGIWMLPFSAHLIPSIMWYLEWFFLGFISSVGLGSGAHTFMLFLAPFIAETATTAFLCNSSNFDTLGSNSFICYGSKDLSVMQDDAISLFEIVRKVFWESFFWGFGTAVGELPPYLIARSSFSNNSSTFKSSASNNYPGLVRHVTKRLISYLHSIIGLMVTKMGFFGILLCASIPNPLFDLAGITCGYYGVPFFSFFVATFIGKALIKATLQTIVVILLVSPLSIQIILDKVKSITSPGLGKIVESVIYDIISSFNDTNKNSPLGIHSAKKISYLGFVWNLFLSLMILYFIITFVHEVARSEYRHQNIETCTIENKSD